MSHIDAFERFFNRVTDKSSVAAEDDRRLYALGERSGLPKIFIRTLYFMWVELHKEDV